MLALKMLFPLVREEFPLKKIKANTRPIKTLSSCYHLGTVLNIHSWSWFSLKILFPSALGIAELTRIQNSYNPLKKGKSGHCIDITWKDAFRFHPSSSPVSCSQKWCGVAGAKIGPRSTALLLTTSSSSAHRFPRRWTSGNAARQLRAERLFAQG